jgi:hypothetical protein
VTAACPQEDQAMHPSDVRKRILDDHTILRLQLAELRSVVQRVLEGDQSLGLQAHDGGERLRRRFLAHLDLEDRYLVPALRGIGAWGHEPLGRDRVRRSRRIPARQLRWKSSGFRRVDGEGAMLLRRRQATATARFERARSLRSHAYLPPDVESVETMRSLRTSLRGARQRFEAGADPRPPGSRRDIILLPRGHIRKKDGGIFPSLDELLGSASKVANHA